MKPKKRVLVLFNDYRLSGGEKTIFESEIKHLSHDFKIDTLIFSNKLSISVMYSYFNIFSLIRLLKKIIIFKPHILYVNNTWFKASTSIFFLAKILNIKVVYKIHNYRLWCSSANFYRSNKICTECKDGNLESSYKYKCYKNSKLLTFLVNQHSKGTLKYLNKKNVVEILVLNSFQKKLLVNKGVESEKIKISNNIVILDKKENNNKSENKYFLFLGRLSKDKGINELLDAWKLIKQDQFKLLIAGDGELKEEIVNKISKQQSVDYIGIIDRSDIFNTISDSYAIVLPSQWLEGQPTVLLEAIQLKTPVVLTNISFINDIKTQNLEVSEFNDVESLSLLISKYMDNDFYNQQKHEWEIIGSKLEGGDFTSIEKSLLRSFIL